MILELLYAALLATACGMKFSVVGAKVTMEVSQTSVSLGRFRAFNSEPNSGEEGD